MATTVGKYQTSAAASAQATGSEGAETGAEGSAAAAVVAMQLPMNDDAAAVRPASSSRPPGVNPRSEQGRKTKMRAIGLEGRSEQRGKQGHPTQFPLKPKHRM